MAAHLDLNSLANPEDYREMRVVLVQTAMGYKPPSGGYRGNYATLVALAKYGHETMQFCWAFAYEIEAAMAEIKSLGLLDEARFDSGKTSMLNENLEAVDVNWCSFINPHGILCVCLDAAVMRMVYPNPIQATDAAAWIEVRLLHSRRISTDCHRPASDHLEQSHTPNGSLTTLRSSTPPIFSSMMPLQARSPSR